MTNLKSLTNWTLFTCVTNIAGMVAGTAVLAWRNATRIRDLTQEGRKARRLEALCLVRVFHFYLIITSLG